MRTFSPKPSDITRQWHVIDAEDVVLGRLASQAAILLRGKHKPIFAPHVDTGDFVIIVNASKLVMTGAKGTQKMAYRHSGYPGGLSSVSYGELLAKRPDRVVELAVRGMLPHTSLGRADAQEAQGLRRPRPPAPGPGAGAVPDPPGRPVVPPRTPTPAPLHHP